MVSSLNTYKIGYLERGRVGMDCVLDVVKGINTFCAWLDIARKKDLATPKMAGRCN